MLRCRFGRVRARFPGGESIKKASTRSWPQTEAIKAEVALAEAQGRVKGSRAGQIVDALFAVFLKRSVKGGWIGWVDPDGVPMVQAIPANTFYRVFLSFADYMRAHSK
jgi:mannose/cellobiose epimerase-like protein (N-acyl-D-glucosamine 2-epimerase family)